MVLLFYKTKVFVFLLKLRNSYIILMNVLSQSMELFKLPFEGVLPGIGYLLLNSHFAFPI